MLTEITYRAAINNIVDSNSWDIEDPKIQELLEFILNTPSLWSDKNIIVLLYAVSNLQSPLTRNKPESIHLSAKSTLIISRICNELPKNTFYRILNNDKLGKYSYLGDFGES